MKNRKIISAITAIAMAAAGSGMSVMAAETPAATQAATKAAATQAATKAAATQAATKAAATKAATTQAAIKAVTTQAATQPATQAPTKAPLTAAQILGVWEGTYDGADAWESGLVKRQIIFNVDQCSEDGSFSGIAEVPSTPGERYIFAGTCDFNTGDVTIQGNEWIVDYNSWNFLRFKGKLDTENMQITGDVGTSGIQFFEYKKTSDEYVDYSVDLNTVPREWYGEYDGFHGDTIVRRNIRFSISEIAENGDIKGTAFVSPSDKADSKYAVESTYYFKGKINERFGRIHIQGYEWIEVPDIDTNFFVDFTGYIHEGKIDGYTVTGYTDNGIWAMETTKVLKGDLNFDNKIDVADLVIMQRYLLADFDFNKSLFYYADMNNDGNVDAFDLVFLRKELIENWL